MKKERFGKIVEILPRALYRVRLDEGQDVAAHQVMGPKKSFVRLVVGDRVVVELTANDSGRGRIVKRVS